MIACTPDSVCPCGRVNAKSKALHYGQCCGQWLEEGLPAPDAHALMRSRYSAYCLERTSYLLRTWHASTRPAELTFVTRVKWLGLQVRRHRVLDADHADVEFVARQREPGGRAVRLHEHSHFVREDGRWYYVDGDLPQQ